MTKRIRIQAVRREQIDLDALAVALLRLARQQLSESEPKPDKTEARDE